MSLPDRRPIEKKMGPKCSIHGEWTGGIILKSDFWYDPLFQVCEIWSCRNQKIYVAWWEDLDIFIEFSIKNLGFYGIFSWASPPVDWSMKTMWISIYIYISIYQYLYLYFYISISISISISIYRISISISTYLHKYIYIYINVYIHIH